MGPTTTAGWNGAQSRRFALQELYNRNGPSQIIGGTTMSIVFIPQWDPHANVWHQEHNFDESNCGQICTKICSFSTPGGRRNIRWMQVALAFVGEWAGLGRGWSSIFLFGAGPFGTVCLFGKILLVQSNTKGHIHNTFGHDTFVVAFFESERIQVQYITVELRSWVVSVNRPRAGQ